MVLQKISDIGRQQVEGGCYPSLATTVAEKGAAMTSPFSLENLSVTHEVPSSICEPMFNFFLVLLELQFKGVEVGGKEK